MNDSLLYSEILRRKVTALKGNRNRSERELLREFEQMLGTKRAGQGVIKGPGDDTAVIRPRAGEDLLYTTDTLVEGHHFERRWFTGRELGWRLAAVNLSDIAAMGGRPLHALMTLAVPPGVGKAYVLGIERGVRDHLKAHGAVIVGGNVSGIASTLVCDLTLIGSVRSGRFWTRAGVAGDAVVVAGRLGESRAGLEVLRSTSRPATTARLIRAYKRPEPLLDVAGLLRGDASVRGAIDVSDGLALDLIRMCEAGRTGCVVETERLAPSRPLAAYCRRRRRQPLDYMLHGGEDYALILSVAPDRAEAVVEKIRRRSGVPAAVIGRFTKRRGHYDLVRSDLRSKPFKASGWDHFKAA